MQERRAGNPPGPRPDEHPTRTNHSLTKQKPFTDHKKTFAASTDHQKPSTDPTKIILYRNPGPCIPGMSARAPTFR